MITTQTADSVLKTYYLDVVSEQLNKSINPLLARISMTTSDVWGKDIRKTVRYGVNGGIGAGEETGDLPRPNSNKYATLVATLKNLYGTIEISDKAIRASQNNAGAFVNLLNDEMDGLLKSATFNFGRMLFGTQKGGLSIITSALESCYIVSTVHNLAIGMLVDVLNGRDEVCATGLEVLSIDRVNKRITLSGPMISSPVGYTIVMQGSKGNELTGLEEIFSSSSTLYGLNRAENPWLNPYSKYSVGAISEDIIQGAIDEVEFNSGSKINYIVCSAGVKRALAKVLSVYRQSDMVELEGGYKTISFNGIPVVSDRFCPPGTMYLLNTDDFSLHQLCDWQWLEGEDGKILKQIPGKPVYTATLVKYAELLCSRPCGQAKLAGITEA